MATLYCRIPSDWIADPSVCLFEWQTLIGGCLALLGAWLTVKAVQIQIKQSETFRQDELRRRHIAARAMMPQALSEISGYCQSIALSLADEIQARNFGNEMDYLGKLVVEHRAETLPPQQFPSEAISALQPFIETLSDKDDIRHVAELFASLQILASRYNSFDFHEAAVVESLFGRLLDTAKVRMLAHTMFNYARFLDETPFGLIGKTAPRDAWDKIRAEAQGLLFSRRNCDMFFAMINERIDRYKEHGGSPWNERFGE